MIKKSFQKTILTYLLGITALIQLSSCGYNSMIEKEERIKSQWAQVENSYQRRADLIPNLVNTVKGAANFEKSTLTEIAEARAKASSIQLDASKLTQEQIDAYQANQDALGKSIGRLLMTVENYPDLKANENFKELQSQLEGTENRIAVERNKFNEATEDYNAYTRKFPQNIVAWMFGFNQKPYFKAREGSDKVPEVKF